TVFEAEAAAMLLAAHLLATKEEVMFPATILADNQAAIKSTKTGHYLLMHLRLAIQEITTKECLARKSITLWWIAGHMKVEGNELADKEAKIAAKGPNFTSCLQELPPVLRKNLPHSVAALKQLHTARLKTLW
ncbi:hypothetical protein M404DRAFT_98116, partial [Pisolithus tinctorius Marx 270]